MEERQFKLLAFSAQSVFYLDVLSELRVRASWFFEGEHATLIRPLRHYVCRCIGVHVERLLYPRVQGHKAPRSATGWLPVHDLDVLGLLDPELDGARTKVHLAVHNGTEDPLMLHREGKFQSWQS